MSVQDINGVPFELTGDMIADPQALAVAQRLMEDPEVKKIQEDYDWRAAFHEGFHGCEGSDPAEINDIFSVIACAEGENDADDWLGVFWMLDGRYLVLRAGCDYTGWDCQASGSVAFYPTVEAACSKLVLEARERGRLESQLRGIVKLDW